MSSIAHNKVLESLQMKRANKTATPPALQAVQEKWSNDNENVSLSRKAGKYSNIHRSQENLVLEEIIIYSDGRKYIGITKGRTPHGYGTMVYNSGDIFDGGWSSGIIHGQGTYVWSDGTTYRGVWYGGDKHGLGSYFSPKSGEWYKCEFEKGKLITFEGSESEKAAFVKKQAKTM
ncbi:MAG: hypothetical protein FWF79_09790 [Defluviitaleaceae bacterium]|nr:hypothetical protein [Defluviitaleaceae bacterium]